MIASVYRGRCVLKEGGGFLQSFEIGVFADGTDDETIGEFAGSVAFERTEMRLWLERAKGKGIFRDDLFADYQRASC